MTSPASDVTRLLLAWGQGEQAALDLLIPLVHRELHHLAHYCLAGERAGHSLQTTALVNEAYLRLVDCSRVKWQDRAHFLAVSARLMRRILVDFARSHQCQKRGAGARRVPLDGNLALASESSGDLLALEEALEALAAFDPRKSNVVEMKFFGGLAVEEIAEVLHVSAQTVWLDWRFARSWLMRKMRAG